MIDYNNVKQTIATNLPDNNKQEITAEKLRSTLNEFVDKVAEIASLEGVTPEDDDQVIGWQNNYGDSTDSQGM